MKITTSFKTLFNALFGDSVNKYEARYEIIRFISNKAGFRMYNKNLCWLHDKEYEMVWSSFPEADRAIHDRRFTLFNLCKLVIHLDGDTAECGAYRGAGSHLILKAIDGDNYTHHIFDSFEGLSDPGEKDSPEVIHAREWRPHDLSVSASIVHNNLKQTQKRVEYHQGWIPSRFEDVANCKFKLVHIDVDLYEPTRASLEFFYPRVCAGGLIICDDYGSENCPGAKSALDNFFKNKPEHIIHLTTGTGFVVKQ